MSLAWYRKWRPQTFSDVIGQDHLIRVLRHALARDVVNHAYLFTGPRGVGKTTTARLLAKSLNCTGKHEAKDLFDPCNKCDNCKSFNEDRMVDVLEIDAASNRGIDDIRAIRDSINLSPMQGKFKVYIIDEVHMLTKEAFNALLKTLEEPPAHVVLVLATTEIQKVPETIISRCQRFDFKPLTSEALATHLMMVAKEEKIQLQPDGAELLAQAATGSGRDALSLLQQVSFLEGKLDAEAVANAMGFVPRSDINLLLMKGREGDVSSSLKFLADKVAAGTDAEQLVRTIIHSLSDAIKGNKADFAQDLTIEQLLAAVEEWSWALENIKNHPEPYVILATAFVGTAKAWGGFSKKSASTPTATTSTAPVVEQEVKDEVEVTKPKTLEAVAWKPGEAEEQLWGKFIEATKPYNHTLASVLKDAELLEISNGDESIVTIGVHFPFHRGRLMEIKNRKILEDVLEKLTGTSYRLKCNLVTNPQSRVDSQHDTEDLAEAATQLFS